MNTLLSYIFIFAFGLAVGSFLNVCIYRIPRGESIIALPSHCTSCGKRLVPRNLIPVLSYLLQKGKCHNCGENISPRYIFVELLTGFIYSGLLYKYGFSIQFVAALFLSSILIIIFFVDLEHGIIPNSIVIVATIGGVVLYIINLITRTEIIGESDWWSPIAGALLGSLIFLLIGAAGSLFYKTDEVIGGGDIKILFPIGLFLGWKLMLLGLFISIVIAGAVCGVLIALKRLKRTDTIPFGPFISIGIMITIIFGWQLIDIYFR